MATFLADLRLALRQLRRAPGFALVVVFTLALGIGSVTTVYTLADGVLFSPLPYDDSDELVFLFGYNSETGNGRWNSSYPDFADYRDRSDSFEHLAVYALRQANVLGAGDRPERMTVSLASHDLFELLGMHPILGRDFDPADDTPGAAPVTVVSRRFWQARLAADPDIVGTSLRINGTPTEIVGVVDGPTFPEDAVLWLPAAPQPGADVRGVQNLRVVGRLADGVAASVAGAQVESISAQIVAENPTHDQVRRARIEPMHEVLVDRLRSPLLLLLGAAAFVLLIVAANVSNLLLHRAAGRGREVATRAALGAGHLQLVRQFLAESLVLVVAGSGLGMLFAWSGSRLLLARMPTDLPRATEVGVDLRVLLFCIAIAGLVAVVFGMVPAAEVLRRNLFGHLGAGARGVGSSGGRFGRALLRRGLVVAEVALAVILVAGATLMIRSLVTLTSVDAGFDPHDVLAVDLELSKPYVSDDWPETVAFYDRLLGELRALPGVVTVAGAHQHAAAPGWSTSFRVEGEPEPEPGRSPEANFRPVTEDYFAALDIPLLRGRLFDPSDVRADPSEGPGIVVVNQAFVRAHLPQDRSPIGLYLVKSSWWMPELDRFEIVGVVADVKFYGRDGGAVPATYYLHRQHPTPALTILLETDGDPAALERVVRETVWSLDPELPISALSTMDERLSETVAYRSFLTQLLSAFAACALFLAALGLYGVLAYATRQRTREIGIRMAMGADRGDVLGLVLGQGLRLTIVGLAGGLVGAWLLSSLLDSLLFGVTRSDPTTLAGVVGAALVVGMAAAFLPAWRAIRIEPTRALQEE